MKKTFMSSFWIFLALLAATVEPIIVKFAYRGDLTAADILAYKHLFAALFILPLAGEVWRIGWRVVGRVLPVALLLMLTNGLTLVALRSLDTATVVTVLKTTPAFVALVNSWRGIEELSFKFWGGFALCFLGILLSLDIFQSGFGQWSLGGLVAIGGAIASSTIYRTRLEVVMTTVRPRAVSSLIFLIDGVFALIAVASFAAHPTPTEWGMVAWIGAAAVVANIAFLAAIHLVGATRMSVFDMLQRPMVIVLAALLLGESLTWEKGLGVALVFVGVYVAKVKRKAPSPLSRDEAPLVFATK